MSAGEIELELMELRERVRRWKRWALVLALLLFLSVAMSVMLGVLALTANGGNRLSAWPSIRQAQLEEQRARMMALELRLAAETARVAAEAERRAAQSIADDSLGKASPTPAGASAVLEKPGEGADSVIKQPLPVEPAE